MSALARSRPFVEIALPRRRPAITAPLRGREPPDLLGYVGARPVPSEPSDPLPLSRIGRSPPAVVPSSTAPAVVPPLPRDATAGGETAFAPEIAAPDAALRFACGDRRRTAPGGIVSALLLHAAVTLGFVLAPRPPLDAGGAETVTMIELIAPGAAETVDAIAGAVPAPEVARPEEAPADPPIVETSRQEPEPETASEPVAVAAPPPTVAEPEATSDVPPPVEAPPPPPPPQTTAPTAPARALAVEVRPARERPRAEPTEAHRTAKRERRKATPNPAPAGNAATERHSGGAAARAEVATPGGQGEVTSWRASVLAALARAKRYPEDARATGRTGRAAVTFTIRRDGSVVGIALAASSGVGSIDGATLDMPRRAAFPPMPAGAGAAQTFTAGVRYDLH